MVEWMPPRPLMDGEGLSPAEQQRLDAVNELAEPVWMAAPVGVEDLARDAEWPPARGAARQRRMQHLYSAAKGDWRWMLTDPADRCIVPDRIAPWTDLVVSLLMATPPQADIEGLQAALEGVAVDALRYGCGLLAMVDGRMERIDIRYAWPVDSIDSGSWAQVVPFVSADSRDGKPDKARVVVYDAEKHEMGGVVHQWLPSGGETGNGRFGDKASDLPTETATLMPVMRPLVEDGWGASALEPLVPIVSEMVLRLSRGSDVLNHHQRPILVLESQKYDLPDTLSAMTDFGKAGERAEQPTVEDLRKHLPSLLRQDVVVAPDGTALRYLQASIDDHAAQSHFERLEDEWTAGTSMSRAEAGDSAHEESGVAVVRKEAKLVARTRRLKEELHRIAEMVADRLFAWEYGTAEEQMDPDPENPEGPLA